MMDDISQIRRELLIVAIGELAAAAVMLGVYALLGKFSSFVLLGAAIGGFLAVGNYAFMAAGVVAAAKKAKEGDEGGAKRVLSISRLVRYLVLFGLLLVMVLNKKFPLPAMIAALVPLVLFRPIVSLGELFRKRG